MLLFGLLAVLIAVPILVWAVVRIRRDAKQQCRLRITPCVLAVVSLMVLDTLFCLVVIIWAGLGHSECAKTEAQFVCLISFVLVVMSPVAGLGLYALHLVGRSAKIVTLLTAGLLAASVIFLVGKLALWPPVMFAVRNGYVGVAAMLVDLGFSSSGRDLCGRSPAPLAALKGDFSMLKLLVEKGADVNSTDGQGATALFSAVQRGDQEMVRYLTDKGARTDGSRDGPIPLMYAAMRGDTELVTQLLDKGANVNAGNAHGTALTWAARGNRIDIVKILLDRGADSEIKTASDHTPLMEASRSGYADVVRLLLNRGADPTAKTYAGETALSLAETKGYKEIVELIRAHADR